MKEDFLMDDPLKQNSIGKQAVILIISGLFLSIGSCAGFLNIGSGSLAVVFGAGFLVGLILVFGALLWVLVHAVTSD
jgi:hypothetical protein